MAPKTRIVDAKLAQSLIFSDHAIERFAERAGVGSSDRRSVEMIARDLALVEGRVVAQRPPWSRSRNTADLYLQVGEWLLYLCGPAREPGRWVVMTVLNNAEMGWPAALGRGLVFAPLPLPAMAAPRRVRARWSESVSAGWRRSRAGDASGGLLATIRAVHRQRSAALEREYLTARDAYDRTQRAHQQAREAAYARHCRLWAG